MVLNRAIELGRWWLIFCGSLAPILLLTWQAASNQLGADPAKEIVLRTGELAIIFLWISLAVTPLRKILKQNWLAKYRRMMGLYGFFYSLAHLLAFATFIIGWSPDLLVSEVTQRPYAIVGFVALLLLLPLALTSTKRMQRKLKKNWVKLHKLVYIIAALALLHVVWQIRSDFSQAFYYGVILCFLLGYRFLNARKRSR
ncbi:MAG: sulfite oxidase heme-binding subunit YedZ [Pseudomonadales bacterium]